MAREKGNKSCFVIASLGPKGSDIRQRADRVYRYIIKPAVESYGYTCLRADPGARPGLITPDMITHLVNDPLVVVDLTDHHPSMFYQLGIRHMVRKPVAQILRKGQTIPVELDDMRAITYELNLEGAENCKEDLIEFIHLVERSPEVVDNPIADNVELRALRRSDNPIERTNAQIVAMLRRLNAKIDTLTQEAEKPELDFTSFAEVWVDLKGLEDALGIEDEELPSLAQIKRAQRLVNKIQRTLGATLNELAAPSGLQWQNNHRAPGEGDAEALGKALANLYKVTTQPMEALDETEIDEALQADSDHELL